MWNGELEMFRENWGDSSRFYKSGDDSLFDCSREGRQGKEVRIRYS